ncbi:MAG TPA: MBL fold metallo-hydrolase [Candidatus Paceibacterota bacterium]|nr:MBL fold metallo-hydrolase [Candidatus Paceibacterota bacterium]
MRISFYGGAGKVTGSNFLVESGESKVLVDCGLEQGGDFAVEEMYAPFPYDPRAVKALVATHAHLDHVGRIPKLVKDGFHGPIYMTPPTKDLAELIMRDSVGILAEDAERRGKDPLYAVEDVDAAVGHIETVDYHEEKEIAPGLSMYLRNTGHILGSASVRFKEADGTTVAFSGDIGNSPSPLLPDWEPVPDADALLMESVYGNRLHPPHEDRVRILRETLMKALGKGGAVLIPAFSLERTQLMLYELSNFFSANELPKVPVFLDSPLAIRVTQVYEKWGMKYFKREAEQEMKQERSLFEFPFLKMTLAKEDSAAIEAVKGPKIIIAGAGMSHGGRIGKWEARYLPDATTTLLVVGYQAPGSPGRRIAEGASSVRVDGVEVKVRASVENIEGWSAHADRDELLAFAKAALPRPKAIFVALGEPAAERFLAQRIHDYLDARAIVPEYGQTWDVSHGAVTLLPHGA